MRPDALFVEEMIEAAERAHALVDGRGVDELASDRDRLDALHWNLTVLGEAANRLSDGLRTRFPEVEWRRPADLRNRIVHGYWSVDVAVLHRTASAQLPAFVEQMRKVLATLDSEG